MNTLIKELGFSQKFLELKTNILQKTSPIVVSGLSSVGKIELI